jgi:glucose/arabinose dehydrogenase
MRIRFSGIAVAMIIAAPAAAQINASGPAIALADAPFAVTTVAQLNRPWRIAFLPDARLLITEKPGALYIVTQTGAKTKVDGTPPVLFRGQAGMLGVFVSPQHRRDRFIYLTYAEPSTIEGEGGLAVARARLVETAGTAKLEGLTVIWRDRTKGNGGQYGGIIAFAPNGKTMFLTVGDRQRFWPAQDPNSPLGKILHLTLDGKPAPGNPGAGKTGPQTIPLYESINDRPAADAAVKTMVTLTEPNLAPAEIWASGIRTPYGLAFDKKGRLWEVEHGPRGGDEVNLIQPGKNYGWPLVVYGTNYDGTPIPSPDTRPDLTKPLIYWTPVIAPGGFAFYDQSMFPQWKGSAFVAGLSGKSLSRITFDQGGHPSPAERWDFAKRIRDVAVAPDGALWVIEDANAGAVMRIAPTK